jgi:hypothetical protein
MPADHRLAGNGQNAPAKSWLRNGHRYQTGQYLPYSHAATIRQEWRTDAVYAMVDRLSAQLHLLNEKGRTVLGPD